MNLPAEVSPASRPCQPLAQRLVPDGTGPPLNVLIFTAPLQGLPAARLWPLEYGCAELLLSACRIAPLHRMHDLFMLLLFLRQPQLPVFILAMETAHGDVRLQAVIHIGEASDFPPTG